MIPITRPRLGAEEGAGACAAIESGWVSQGPKVAEFERCVAEYCGAAHAVAVSNCTTALHLALLVLGIGPGDEVICPSMSFIATANAVAYTGATPVFAEVDPLTYNLDVEAAEAAIGPATRAILLVHQIGLPADLDAFGPLASERGLHLVEDAACALGSRHRGVLIGCESELACFSFHPRKVITTGEGGMLLTHSESLADQLRLLRHQGMSVSDLVRHQSDRVIAEQYVCVGYNYRLTDIQAAIGLAQMGRLENILQRRRELAAVYSERLRDHPWLRPPHVPEGLQPNYQSYAVQLTDGAPVTRDEVMQRLLDRGIATRRGSMLRHQEPAYEGVVSELPRSELASGCSLLLPLFPDMTAEEQEQVLTALEELV